MLDKKYNIEFDRFELRNIELDNRNKRLFGVSPWMVDKVVEVLHNFEKTELCNGTGIEKKYQGDYIIPEREVYYTVAEEGDNLFAFGFVPVDVTFAMDPLYIAEGVWIYYFTIIRPQFINYLSSIGYEVNQVQLKVQNKGKENV